MMTSDAFPADLKVFLNHVYEFKKGVRNMVLYTTNRKNESFAVARLASHTSLIVCNRWTADASIFFSVVRSVSMPFVSWPPVRSMN